MSASDTSYFSTTTTTEADALAATLPGLAAFKGANSADKIAALVMASIRIDGSRRWQGRKYDLANNQVLEFPRVARDGPSNLASFYPTAAIVGGSATEIWDWDYSNNVAVVPRAIKLAALFEADSILSKSNDELKEKLALGLTGQSVGDMSEVYARVPGTATAAGVPVLCREAENLVQRYRLTSGQMR